MLDRLVVSETRQDLQSLSFCGPNRWREGLRYRASRPRAIVVFLVRDDIVRAGDGSGMSESISKEIFVFQIYKRNAEHVGLDATKRIA